MNIRELVAKWQGQVIAIDSANGDLTPRLEGKAFGIQQCASELESLAPKYERVVEAAKELIAADRDSGLPDHHQRTGALSRALADLEDSE